MTTSRFEADRKHNALGTLPPAFTVASGDALVTETIDAHGTDKDGVESAADFVANAEPGDALRVEILRMTPIRDRGWTRISLDANVVGPDLVRQWQPAERTNWCVDLQASTAALDPAVPGPDRLVLPLEPMIGCFGVTPARGQAVSTATSAENGHNMDYRGFGPGSAA